MLPLSWMVTGDGVLKKKKGKKFWTFKRVETVKRVVKASLKLKIPIVTFYVFLLKIGKDQ